MKQQIKYLSLCFLAAGLLSCDSDEAVIDTREVGANAVLVDHDISVFDQNEDVTIELFSNNVNFETVTIEDTDGNQLTTANISDGIATFSTSSLGDFAFGDDNDEPTGSFDFRIVSTLSNGEVLDDPASIAVHHAISLGDDNPTETNLDSLSTRVLEYELFTHAATVDGVTLMLKKNKAGTYTDSGLTDLPTDEGAVELSETNYAALNLMVNDTLYYMFTATSGSLTDSASSYIAINNKEFAVSNEGTLSSDLSMNQYNLYTGEDSANGDEDGEIAFLAPTGFEVINGASIDFVQVADDYFDNSGEGVVFAREAYMDPLAVKLSSFTNVSNGDVFVYSTMRDVLDEDGEPTGDQETVYGILKIGEVSTTTVDGETVVSFNVENMEGN